MRKSLLFLLLLTSVYVKAQTVTIGSGGGIAKRFPFDYQGEEYNPSNPLLPFTYPQSRCATIYRYNVIGNASQQFTITKLRWNCATNGYTSPTKIYLKAVTEQTQTASVFWYNKTDNATLVYSGTPTWTVGWNEFDITDFVLPNAMNLEVLIECNNIVDLSSNTYLTNTITNASQVFKYDNPAGSSGYIDSNYLGSISPAVSNVRPFLQMTYTLASCLSPVTLYVTNVTDSSGTIFWDPAPGTPAAYDIYVSPSPVAPDNATTPLASVTPDITQYFVKNLLPSTKYYYWVRSSCSGNEHSVWGAKGDFTTQCKSVNSFSENFDATPLNTVPTCWSKFDNFFYSTDNQVTVTDQNALSGTNALVMLHGECYLILPNTNNLTAGTHRLRFSAFGTNDSYVPQNIQIGTIDACCSGSFNSLKTFSITTPRVYAQYVADLDTYTGPDTHIAIRTIEDNGAILANGLYIDDVFWEPNVYTFTGTGNWSETANWTPKVLPPVDLNSGEIIIAPSTNGQCVLDRPQRISNGKKITVSDSKKILIQGNLEINNN